MSKVYAKKPGAKICLPIEMDINLIFNFTISLFVKIVSYFVFPDHIRFVLKSEAPHILKRRICEAQVLITLY